jgi:hypothetical protein
MRMKKDHMKNGQVEAIVKYGTYHKEKSKRWQNDVSKIDNWDYNEDEDTWTCKAGQKLAFYRKSKDKTEIGYEIEYHHYRSIGCEGCPLKPSCTKAASNRKVKVSLKYMRMKKQARDKLRSNDGYALLVRRIIEPESVFGQIKNNRGFRRSCFAACQK